MMAELLHKLNSNSSKVSGELSLEIVEKDGENTIAKIVLPAHLQGAFINILKCGIYKELHKREMLSDTQLSHLLNECLEGENKEFTM